jgi:hypothetical protein
MLWQFGELGYDFSINTCTDGTVKADCRISPKPVKWDYRNDAARKNVFDVTADLIRLRNKYEVFTTGEATVTAGKALVKQVILKNKPFKPVPASSAEMNVVAITNFDIVSQSSLVEFPHTGTWYDYYNAGEPLAVNTTASTISLAPGQYKLYTDVKIEIPNIVTALEELVTSEIVIYPNPVKEVLKLKWENRPIDNVSFISMQGVKSLASQIDSDAWDSSHLSSGLYIVEIISGDRVIRKKIMKL